MVHEMTGISFSLMNYIFEYHTQPYITYYIKEQPVFSMWLMKKTSRFRLVLVLFLVLFGLVPSPHLPSGIAFSWMGDGL